MVWPCKSVSWTSSSAFLSTINEEILSEGNHSLLNSGVGFSRSFLREGWERIRFYFGKSCKNVNEKTFHVLGRGDETTFSQINTGEIYCALEP